MGKKVRVQINPNEMFLDTAHDAVSRSQIMRSPIWPVVVAVYSFCEKRVKIGPSKIRDNGETIIHILTPSGMRVACVAYLNSIVYIKTADTAICGHGVDNTMGYSTKLESNNIRYAVSRFSNSSSHDIKGLMQYVLQNAENVFNETMRDILDRTIHAVAGTSVMRPSMSIDRSVSAALMHVVIGNVPKSDLRTADLQAMEKIYATYQNEMSVFRGYVERASNMFTGDKWLVIPDVLGGIVLGAITPQPMLAAYERYLNDSEMPYASGFSYIDQREPIKWYKNVESIPAEIRSELEVSAMMLKAHSNSAELFPTDKTNNGFVVWEPIEAIGYKTYNTNHASLFLLSK